MKYKKYFKLFAPISLSVLTPLALISCESQETRELNKQKAEQERRKSLLLEQINQKIQTAPKELNLLSDDLKQLDEQGLNDYLAQLSTKIEAYNQNIEKANKLLKLITNNNKLFMNKERDFSHVTSYSSFVSAIQELKNERFERLKQLKDQYDNSLNQITEKTKELSKFVTNLPEFIKQELTGSILQSYQELLLKIQNSSENVDIDAKIAENTASLETLKAELEKQKANLEELKSEKEKADKAAEEADKTLVTPRKDVRTAFDNYTKLSKTNPRDIDGLKAALKEFRDKDAVYLAKKKEFAEFYDKKENALNAIFDAVKVLKNTELQIKDKTSLLEEYKKYKANKEQFRANLTNKIAENTAQLAINNTTLTTLNFEQKKANDEIIAISRDLFEIKKQSQEIQQTISYIRQNIDRLGISDSKLEFILLQLAKTNNSISIQRTNIQNFANWLKEHNLTNFANSLSQAEATLAKSVSNLNVRLETSKQQLLIKAAGLNINDSAIEDLRQSNDVDSFILAKDRVEGLISQKTLDIKRDTLTKLIHSLKNDYDVNPAHSISDLEKEYKKLLIYNYEENSLALEKKVTQAIQDFIEQYPQYAQEWISRLDDTVGYSMLINLYSDLTAFEMNVSLENLKKIYKYSESQYNTKYDALTNKQQLAKAAARSVSVQFVLSDRKSVSGSAWLLDYHRDQDNPNKYKLFFATNVHVIANLSNEKDLDEYKQPNVPKTAGVTFGFVNDLFDDEKAQEYTTKSKEISKKLLALKTNSTADFDNNVKIDNLNKLTKLNWFEGNSGTVFTDNGFSNNLPRSIFVAKDFIKKDNTSVWDNYYTDFAVFEYDYEVKDDETLIRDYDERNRNHIKNGQVDILVDEWYKNSLLAFNNHVKRMIGALDDSFKLVSKENIYDTINALPDFPYSDNNLAFLGIIRSNYYKVGLNDFGERKTIITDQEPQGSDEDKRQLSNEVQYYLNTPKYAFHTKYYISAYPYDNEVFHPVLRTSVAKNKRNAASSEFTDYIKISLQNDNNSLDEPVRFADTPLAYHGVTYVLNNGELLSGGSSGSVILDQQGLPVGILWGAGYRQTPPNIPNFGTPTPNSPEANNANNENVSNNGQPETFLGFGAPFVQDIDIRTGDYRLIYAYNLINGTELKYDFIKYPYINSLPKYPNQTSSYLGQVRKIYGQDYSTRLFPVQKQS
ncbi:MIP family Ig-specific serine endopeptidase [Mycoplasma corogypsi]|uniref:MIP family Ig-specific serine endopeptidase n=1 Tax=Mycoplasma corogypsi TaxID=2106 RepID=UPI003873C9A5